MNIRIGQAVQEALNEGKPVVALESTIISHGMPYPQNFETAMSVEDKIREFGAVPATIGIIDGVPVVGMDEDEIHQFSKRKGVIKASRRDLAMITTKKLWGATTVASTMIFASMAGIKVFVTGGIGGVHRDAETTWDVSADLEELGKTPVTVICSGPKAILDIPLTLEYLETKGVPVIGFKSSELANFYSTNSGYKVDYMAENEEELANMIRNQSLLGLNTGILVSNPIPPQYSLPHEYIDRIIDEALDEMNEKGIKGKEATPFLLAKVAELTEGKSLASNIKLILNNAEVGAKIAVELAKLC